MILCVLAGCADKPRHSSSIPHQIGGFVLGDDIAAYQHRLKMQTDLPVRHIEALHEVEIKPSKWFKSGLICYGKCAEPGNIIRIKLKYADASRKFFDELLRRYKQRFGEPDEWRGDPFQIMIAWKWSFEDQAHNRISLILQHNVQDIEEKMGNAVKMTMTSSLKKEQRCFEAKQGKGEGKKTAPLIPLERIHQNDWELLLPR